MIQMKKNKGITLVALVVTIIVLLILAAVSINLVLGENGIVTRAKQAKKDTQWESLNEKVELWRSENSITEQLGEDNYNSLDSFLVELKNQNLITEEQKTEIETTGKLQEESKVILFEEEPGLYNYKTNELIYSWQELIDDGKYK